MFGEAPYDGRMLLRVQFQPPRSGRPRKVCLGRSWSTYGTCCGMVHHRCGSPLRSAATATQHPAKPCQVPRRAQQFCGERSGTSPEQNWGLIRLRVLPVRWCSNAWNRARSEVTPSEAPHVLMGRAAKWGVTESVGAPQLGEKTSKNKTPAPGIGWRFVFFLVGFCLMVFGVNLPSIVGSSLRSHVPVLDGSVRSPSRLHKQDGHNCASSRGD